MICVVSKCIAHFSSRVLESSIFVLDSGCLVRIFEQLWCSLLKVVIALWHAPLNTPSSIYVVLIDSSVFLFNLLFYKSPVIFPLSKHMYSFPIYIKSIRCFFPYCKLLILLFAILGLSCVFKQIMCNLILQGKFDICHF